MTNQPPTTITPRQLRGILFLVTQQDMTVRELRSMLFNIDDQDKEYKITRDMFERMMVDAAEVNEEE
jgi:hypothetical protein